MQAVFRIRSIEKFEFIKIILVSAV